MSSIPFPTFVDSGDDTNDAGLPNDLNNEAFIFSSHLADSSMLQHSQLLSPSLNNTSTPADSVALSLHYQSSEPSDIDIDGGDDAFFDAFLNSSSSILTTSFGGAVQLTVGPSEVSAQPYATPEPVLAGGIEYPISPEQTPSLNTSPPCIRDNLPVALKDKYATNIAFAPGFNGVVSPQQLAKQSPAVGATDFQAFVLNDVLTNELTPDSASTGAASFECNSLGSLSGKGLAASTASTSLPMAGQNPHVTVSLWGKDGATNLEPSSTTDDHARHRESSPVLRNPHGVWEPHASTGLRGISPSQRSSAEMATSINEDTQEREVEHRNIEVDQWLKKAEHVQLDARHSGAQQPSEAFEGVSDRAINLGNGTQNVQQPGRTYFTGNEGPLTSVDQELMHRGHIWDDSPAVLDILEGNTRYQPESSQAAIERYQRLYSDNASLVSRAATWGTRRLSLPSIADIEDITSGNLLKKLNIKDSRRQSILGNLRDLVRKPNTNNQLKRVRSNRDDEIASNIEANEINLYQPFADTTQDGKAPNSLAPPRTQSWGKGKQQMNSINTALVSMGNSVASIGTTHARSGSVSRPHAGSVSLSPPLTSPKSPLLKVGNTLRRPRSKSDLVDSGTPNIMRMLKKTGGPPVAALATPTATAPPNNTSSYFSPVPGGVARQLPSSAPPFATAPMPSPIQIPATAVAVPDPDDDDDDEEDMMDDGGLKSGSDELIDKISPDFSGFREFVLALNPMLADTNTYLADRIAHQQIIRYKGLLGNKVKHLNLVKGHACPNKSLCIGQGGAVVVQGTKKDAKNSGDSAYNENMENQDLNSPIEGMINPETFPKYIPMPRTAALPAEFECQLCFQTKKFQKPSDWTKHVHEDVQPFTCTWDRCRDPKIFKRKADWVRHENEGHRHLEWWTCDVEDCHHTCFRRDNFLQHLVREHKFNEPKYKTKTAIKKAGGADTTWQRVEKCHAETTAKPQDEPCRFCGAILPTWKKLTVHLASHMAHISLPILRLVEKKVVDYETIISPVQDPPPRTFAPPVTYAMPANVGHLGGMGSVGSSMMAQMMGPVHGSGDLNHHQHLGQTMVYTPAGPHGANTYAYAPASQVQFTTPFYSQAPYTTTDEMAPQIQSLNAAAGLDMPAVGSGFVDPQSYSHSLPVTTGGYMGPVSNHYISDAPGMGVSSYSDLSASNALGLQATGPAPYDVGVDPSLGSGSNHYTPQGSVSPYGRSPNQGQGQFYPQ